MHASGAWWSSDYNIKAAFDMDLQLWLLRVIDQKLTGEHNAAVWRRRNPKAEAAIPPPFNVKSGETYANTIIPERLRKLLGISKKETVEAAQKDAVQQLRELMMHGRKMRGEA